MAASHKSAIESKFEQEFKRMTTSQYCVYKNPTNFYEKLINTLAVSRKQRRSGLFAVCPLESTYKDWKERRFPEVEISAEVFKACRNLDQSAPKKQIAITSFFKAKDTIPAESVENADNVREVVQDETVPSSTTCDDLEGGNGANQSERTFSHHLKRLYEILELKGGSEVASKLDGTENINTISKDVNTLLDIYTDKEHQLYENAFYFQSNSQFSVKRQEASEMITAVKEQLKTLHEYIVAMSDQKIMEKKTIAETVKFISHCDTKCSELKTKITQMLLNLKNILSDVNLRFAKRLSNMKSKINSSTDIQAQNSDKSWDECIELVENVKSGLFKFSVEEFESTKNYFSWLARSKHEYCSVQDLLDYLGRPHSDSKQIVQTVVKYLPVISIKSKNQTLLLDCEQFFGSAIKIATLVDMLDRPSPSDGKEMPSIPSKSTLKGPWKPGSGRPAWIDRRPDIVRSVNEFASNCGIMAQERRRDITGKMGFGIPDVHRFVKEKFFSSEPEKAPSKATLRRFFSAATKANKASRYYKEVIKAKPCTKRNDETVGVAHKHRHHAFTIVKAAREFSAKHKDETVVISADDKCKLPIGPPVVSRLVNLRKFFPSGDEPKLPDHDIRSGMCLTPNGYMILQQKEWMFNNLPTSSAKSMAEEVEESSDDESDEEVDVMSFVEVEDVPAFIDVSQFLDEGLHSNHQSPDTSLDSTSSNVDQLVDVETEPTDSFGSTATFSTKFNLDGLVSSGSDSESEQNPPKKTKRMVLNSDSEENCEEKDNPRDFGPDETVSEHEKNVEKDKETLHVDSSDSSNEEGNLNPPKKTKRMVLNSDSEEYSEEENNTKKYEDIRPEVDNSESEKNDGKDEETLNADSSDSSDEEGKQETDSDLSAAEEELNDNFRIIQDEIGRDHISYPATGKFYIFLKSHNFKPSTIQAHINDIFNIYQSNPEMLDKKVATFIVDDGADYGIRSLSTLHFFGRLWIKLNLDMLIVVKNAPRDSKHNPVEHGWGFITPKLAGVVLPTKLQGEVDDDIVEDGGDENEDKVEKNPEV